MITSKTHAVLDYVTGIVFLLAPAVVPLSETGTLLAYALAIVHLLMTFFTDFYGGFIRAIPFSFHGYVELIVGVALTTMPWLLSDSFIHFDKLFFSALGIIIIAVWFSTTYKKSRSRE